MRIILDVRFGINGFQSQANWLYVCTWEAMSVSHSQHRLSLGSVRCSPDPMQLHHVWTIERSGLDKDAMIVYTMTCHNTGHADLVRIIPDLSHKVNAFQSQAHWLYVFTWEAMSVSHLQRRLSLGSVRCSPDPMQLHHVWTIERSGLDKDAMIVYTMTCHNTGHADLVRIIPDLSHKVNSFPSRPHWLYLFSWEAMSVLHAQHR